MLAERKNRQRQQGSPQAERLNRFGDEKLMGQTQQEWEALMEEYERDLKAKKNSSLGEQSNSSISSSDLSDSTVVAEEEAIKMNQAKVYVGCDDNNNNKNNNNHLQDASRDTRFDCTTEVSECLEQLVEAVASATNHRLPYETFKLNEVVLAETRLSTSESEDEFPSLVEVQLVGEFCLKQAEFELNKQHVINLAQDYYAIQKVNAKQTTLVSLSPGTSEWRQAREAIDCLASERFVVWIVKKEEGECGELDLDDIALALNEPVSSATPKQEVRVIIWHCPQPSDSRRVETLWRNSIRRNAVEPKDKQADDRQIEVPAKSDRGKSGGLFVLPGRKSPHLSESKCSNSSSDSDLFVYKPDGSSHSSAGSNLANYYRTVANKVMTNGSTRLRSLKDEMSRLNGSGQSLVKSARRLSMAIQNQPTRSDEPQLTGCVLPPKVKPRLSVLKASKISSDKEAHKSQVSSTSVAADEQKPRSILKKANKFSRPTQTETTSQVERVERDNREDVEDKRQQASKLASRTPVLDINSNLEQQDEQPVSRNSDRLLRLRAGSTSSVASRSRQRRPALLLRNEEAEQSVEESPTSPLPAKITSSSKVDGLVRAKVSASHLKRSASMKMIDASAKQQQVVASAATKKSEFDPRSLRRLPGAETNRPLRCSATVIAAATASTSDSSRAKLLRQRRSVANLQTLISSPSEDEMDDGFAATGASGRVNDAAAALVKPNSSKLGSRGALNKLRQSFNQRNLSMLKFSSGRASFSVKAANLATPQEAVEQTRTARELGHEFRSTSSQDLDQQTGGGDRRLEKGEALRLAEAKLQAAKQLKQQAQKLREQQKRVEQQQQLQQQQTSLNSVAMLLYQQQIQKQQQQLIYHQQQQQQQQQLLFDPLNVQMRQQHQLFAFQRQQQQQQQQLAYMSSAHFMAQHVQPPGVAASAMAVANFSHMYPMAQLAGPAAMPMAAQSMLAAASAAPPLHSLPGSINHSMISSHGGINNKSVYQAQTQQQYIPMSVNHHSSFNIVYNTAAASPNSPHSQAPAFVSNPNSNRNQPQPAALNMTQNSQMFTDDESLHFKASFRKHTSLGASVRKTVRNILKKTSSSSSTSTSHKLNSAHIEDQAALAPPTQKPLKSALKQANSAAKERDLNSEGSDGDASSTSDSTVDCSRPMASKSVLKRSMMREQDHQNQFNSKKEHISSSSSSSNSSLVSSSSSSSNSRKSSTIARDDMDRLRKEFIRNEPSQFGDTHHRKNVTFSSQLISIL